MGSTGGEGSDEGYSDSVDLEGSGCVPRLVNTPSYTAYSKAILRTLPMHFKTTNPTGSSPLILLLARHLHNQR
ncbi:hypothetical protein E2C01_071296 [Portunus trituberculatus]|uniref:Uncharacterized protein n=1 Tax=Portunus trituberculatus TaxID=210409 RepID=A0A5B7HZL5_PORTR|nr:hypothetical protein [Portunus trituberculatus]